MFLNKMLFLVIFLSSKFAIDNIFLTLPVSKLTTDIIILLKSDNDSRYPIVLNKSKWCKLHTVHMIESSTVIVMAAKTIITVQ